MNVTSVTPIPGVSQLAGKTVQAPPPNQEVAAEPKVASDLSAQPRETAPDKGQDSQNSEASILKDAVEQLQAKADLAGRSLQFRIDKTNNTSQILVVDKDSGDVIRKIPPDEILKLAERIKETLSLLFDASA